MFRISISNHKQTVRAGGRVVSIPPSSEFVEIFFAKINTKIELSLLGHISLPTLSGTTNSAGGDAEHETYCAGRNIKSTSKPALSFHFGKIKGARPLAHQGVLGSR